MIFAIAFVIVTIAAMYQATKSIQLQRHLNRQVTLTRMYQGNYELLKATLDGQPQH